METTWIIAADSSRARIFEVQGVGKNFHEIQDFSNAAGREHYQDLRTDAKGRYYGKGEREQAHTAEPEVDAVQHETELYAKKVCEYLDKARVEKRYDGLFVVAFPKFIGMLRGNLSKEAQHLIKREIAKDISWFDAKDIAEFYTNNRLP